MNIYEKLAVMYPQLLLPIKEGEKDSEEYKDICLKLKETDLKPNFITSEKDNIEIYKTIAGDAQIISIYNREDFVHAVRALGNKCEPVDVPDSTGAIAIFGLNNVEKFKNDEEVYKDNIIILSAGYYSNVDNLMVKDVTGGEIDLSKEEWIDKSITIRKYHELTHFIMRNIYPDNIDFIRDELIADMIGIISAFGYFDTRLIKLFLGIEADTYREGGRLQNYKGANTNDYQDVLARISKLEELSKSYKTPEELYKNVLVFM